MRELLLVAGWFVVMLPSMAAFGQFGATGITVGVSPSGSTTLTYVMPLIPGCYEPRPTNTTVARSSNSFVLNTVVVSVPCFPTPPGNAPQTIATVDVGFLSAGQYQVTWSMSGDAPTERAPGTLTFVIAQDQTPAPVPTLSEYALIALAAMLGGGAFFGLRRRPAV